ncbi:hypothetical protein SprV_0301036500 [Sparganum proliferum]
MASNDSQKDSHDINTLSFKLPPFTPSNPRVWFRQIEALFATSRITSERTRYSYVLQSLPFDVAVTVEDLLDPIPADEPYTRLKEAIIQRVAKSANFMLRELFTQVELGDQTPSQLMRHMRSLLAGKDMDDAIFREIWLEKLPVPMQQVLAMLDSNIPLEKLATHADRIKECYPIGTACSNIKQPPPSKGKPHQGIVFDSEGPALSEHDTPYTEKTPCCCTTRRAPTLSGPPRIPTDAYRTDYDDLRDTVRLLCTQVSNMCSALNSLQSARKQPYSHRRSKSLKRPRQPVMATTAGPSRPSRLFYINDKSSGLRFLVDTGAEVSVIPPLRRHRLKPSQFSLQAANSTTISTYGQRCLTLDLGLRRRFQWVFTEADVKSPIIGADFLSSFGLTVDVRHRRLTDTTTQLFTIAHTAFEEAKKALTDATMLHHLSSDAHAQLILTTDASSSAVGTVLHQPVNNQLQPLAFFSQKLQPAQTRYSTFSRELLAIYLAIRHFRHLSEGRDFSVHTDHKPLTYALKAKPDRYSPREVRHLDYISQFTADIRYVRGSDNVVADALSRPDINTHTSDFDLAKLADLQTADESIADLRTSTTLQLRDAPLPSSPGTILCDWSTGTPRPVVPPPYRKVVFEHFHSLSHPGIRAGHVRFNHAHLDLIGPSPPSRGYTHILTAVDRFTRWPIAVPISDTSAENIAMVFLTHWISTFGVPSTLTNDRGSQFQSSLFREFTRLLGCAHITTTAYHPASNDLVERLHRQPKSAMMSQTESATWSVNVPLVLLGIRSSVKEDIQCTAAELVYGTPLRLPGEFVRPSTTNTNILSTFVQQLKQRMAQLRPTPTRLTSKHVFVHEDLKSAPFVFVRHDTVHKPLCPPYDGPYKVVQWKDKFCVLQKADKTDTVSIDRLKPAYLECLPSTSAPSIPPTMSSPDTPTPVTYPPSAHLTILPTQPDPPSTSPPISSRSGRHIRFCAKHKDFVV